MVSILIVNWNTREKLAACLESIRRFPPQMSYEVIVVDNASTDGSAAMIEQSHPEVRLVSSQTNMGYALGNNAAFRLAQGSLLLTLNPDTEFTDFSIQRAVDGLLAAPEAGSASVRFRFPDGRDQASVRGFPSPLGLLGAGLGLDRLLPNSPFGSYSLPRFDYSRTQWAPQPMGTFLLFTRQALETVGNAQAPFDEGFPIFFNEVDLLKRLDDSGWKCLYIADASLIHHHGSSTKQVKPAMIWESHHSLARYLKKHLRGPERLWIPILVGLSYASALVRARGWKQRFVPPTP